MAAIGSGWTDGAWLIASWDTSGPAWAGGGPSRALLGVRDTDTTTLVLSDASCIMLAVRDEAAAGVTNSDA